jgi:hypothetical protein
MQNWKKKIYYEKIDGKTMLVLYVIDKEILIKTFFQSVGYGASI